MEYDVAYLKKLEDLYVGYGGNFYFVELKADLETRKERNVTPNRLAKKYSKNDIEKSMKDLIKTSENYRLNTLDNETICQNHLKIDNTNKTPEEVANIVINTFKLVSTNKEKENLDIKSKFLFY